MNDLYTQEMLTTLQKRLKSRWLILAVVFGLLLAGFVYSMIIRIEWLSVLLLGLAGCFAIFWTDLFIMPLLQYRKLLRAALNGRSHVGTLEYVRTEPDESMVDGVPCLGMVFLGEPDKHGSREQLFYWDRELPLPTLSPGQEYTIKYTGKNIIGM